MVLFAQLNFYWWINYIHYQTLISASLYAGADKDNYSEIITRFLHHSNLFENMVYETDKFILELFFPHHFY